MNDPTAPTAHAPDSHSRSRPRPSFLLGALAGAALVGAMLVLPGLAQPDRGPGGPPPGEGPRMGERQPDHAPMAPAEFRARLERRLEDVRLIEKRLEEGIQSLDAGASPDEVMRTLFAPGLRWGMDGGRGSGGGPDGRGSLTPEERERLRSEIRQHMPRVAEWIEQLERDEPSLVEAVSTRLAPQIREINRLRERDPEGARVRTAELVTTLGVMHHTRVYRRAASQSGFDSEQARQAEAMLRVSLEEQFAARLAARQHEIEALGRRIESLRSDIESETGASQRLIDVAMERIKQDALRPAQDSDHPEGAPPPPPGRPPTGG